MTASAPRQLTRFRTALAATGIGAAGLAIAGCGSTAPNGSVSLPTFPAGAQSTPSGAVGPTTGNVGDTLSMVDLGDDVAHVTLVKIFDPPTGYDPNTTPPDGTRWVAFEGTIVVDGDRAGQDATDFDVIGSDGQTYGDNTSYALSVFDGCTASDIDDIKPGQTQTICSAVGVPPGVTVAKVGYSTEGVNGSAPAKLFWTVSSDQDAAPTATPTADGSAPTASPTPAAATSSITGNVGDTLTYTDSGGDATQVTLVKILDPAPGVDPGTAPPSGTRWVGFEGTISGDGASDDAMTFDVVGSDGHTYGDSTSYHLTAFGGCSANTEPAAGQPVTFCAGVGLPPGVTVATVGYSLEGVDTGGTPELFWAAA